jgi:hypothetical protein
MSGTTAPQAAPGVVTLPGDSPMVAPAIRESVDRFLGTLEADTTSLMLELETEAGGNLAIAHRSESGRLGVVLWVGKSGWDKPLKQSASGGVKVALKLGGK